MNFDHLHVFSAIARSGSFAAVAKERNSDPSSISRAVADLEAELGFRLFQRSTRAMTLTEAGATYLARVEPLLDELAHAREAAAQMNSTPRGLLRLTASVSFGQICIVPLLAAFRARYPDLKVECVFSDSNLNLIAEGIDLAIRLAPTIEGDLVAAKLMDTHYGVYASPAYLAQCPATDEPADLSKHKVLLFNLRAYRTRWLFRDVRDADGSEQSVPIQGDLTLAPAGSLLSAAMAGLGPALLPDWLVSAAVANGSLVQLFPGYAATATSFDTAAWVVYPSRAFLPYKVRVMIDFLREHLQA